MSADTSSWRSTSARWYTPTTSDAHLPRCRITFSPASPNLSRRSVAPPIRQHLPPNSSGSRPHADAMRRASLREVA
eukprot:5498756-Pleurochrysis_carterae.AAC.1